MASGQSIRVFLADGSVTGIRHAEVVNWAGQALACPRSRVGELAEWEEANRPGVYLLFGIDDATSNSAVYIGEAENVLDRLQSHLAQKDFWNEIVLFSNKDENLTKAHVRYLEAKLTEGARLAARYVVKNGNNPQAASLPRGDRVAMESFFDQARLLLGVLGHRVLEPITVSSASRRVLGERDGATAEGGSMVDELRLNAKGLQARAVLTDEGIVVLKGSRAASAVTDSISGGYRKLRDRLIAQSVLVADGESLRFAQDWLFTSPSAAACVVVGYPINGRDAWRTNAGRSIADVEDSQVGLH
jgi:hypothetical protein